MDKLQAELTRQNQLNEEYLAKIKAMEEQQTETLKIRDMFDAQTNQISQLEKIN